MLVRCNCKPELSTDHVHEVSKVALVGSGRVASGRVGSGGIRNITRRVAFGRVGSGQWIILSWVGPDQPQM